MLAWLSTPYGTRKSVTSVAAWSARMAMTGLARLGGRMASIARACSARSMGGTAGAGAERLPGASTIAATAGKAIAAIPRQINSLRMSSSG
jgi:hypothetical protein